MLKLPLFILLTSFSLFSQQTPLVINSFFKDHLFDNEFSNTYLGNSFLPALASENSVLKNIEDTTFFQTNFSKHLFQKHLVEVEGPNYQLSISPIFNFSVGQDQTNSIQTTLFRNTRGIYVEGNLMNKVSFVSIFSENQARYSLYESDYYMEHGELYPVDLQNYQTQNAVIPGAARTKPFKENGFDYSFATGLLVYQPCKKVVIIAGNSSQFIGDGYRSMLLSDNALPAPYFKINYKISAKWEINYMRMRALNLVRKNASNSVEAYYDPKAFSVNYFTYHFTPKIALSFFEGILWTMGDSVQTTGVNPLFFSPVPFLAEFTQSNKNINTILGINISVASINKVKIYGQFALGSVHNAFAYQIGMRAYSPFGWKKSMIQLEFNKASETMYQSTTARLNYSNGNLPMAHSAGAAFNELVFRFNTEFKRCYLDVKSNLYQLKNYSSISLLPVQKLKPPISTSLFLQAVEVGYRFNKKMNFCLFASWQYRSDINNILIPTNQLFFGIKTAITNYYSDF